MASITLQSTFHAAFRDCQGRAPQYALRVLWDILCLHGIFVLFNYSTCVASQAIRPVNVILERQLVDMIEHLFMSSEAM